MAVNMQMVPCALAEEVVLEGLDPAMTIPLFKGNHTAVPPGEATTWREA
jgi:hypothetical protein